MFAFIVEIDLQFIFFILKVTLALQNELGKGYTFLWVVCFLGEFG